MPQPPSQRQTYSCSFYVPELLLERHPLDGEPNGGFAGDRDKSVLLALAPEKSEFALNKNFWDDNPAVGNYSPFSSADEFYEKVDECKVLGIGTMDLTERNDDTDNPRLPNPQWYSKFSILRNRHNFAKVKFTLLDQNGGVNQQAYFSNLGNVQQVQAESGNKPKWVAFGNWEDVHFDGGFGECEINWAETSGINQPNGGKNILKIEFFADAEMTRPVKDSQTLYISVRGANWKEEFRKLK